MPGLKRAKTHADEFADLHDPTPLDLDPEDDLLALDSDGSEDSSIAQNASTGREHYEIVGKSQLRHGKDPASLGPQYIGSRVSRKAAQDSESDSAELFDRYESDEGSDIDVVDAKDGNGDEPSDELDSLDDTTDATSLSDASEPSAAAENDREELKRLMAQEQRNVVTAVSEANRVDAEKGRAVRAQRKTFDGLLNTRVQLQQALIAVNTLPTVDLSPSNDGDTSSVTATEEALCRLLESMDSLRQSMSATTGSKRKRQHYKKTAPISDLWNQLDAEQEQRKKERRAVLSKWSRKTDATSGTQQTSSKLTQGAPTHGIVDVLDEQLVNSERLVKRTRMPRSSAPMQAKSRVEESPEIFDDADFYGLLLKELLEQRNNDASGQTSSEAVAQHWRAAREARTRKNVDTKASKGRKMRFTVHEKLQNFMVPEDRGSWSERQTDELFGSLFGQRPLGNGQDVVNQEDEREQQGEQALALFRTA